MDEQLASSPPQRPLAKHARIEADLFCDHCGYNLHTQAVVRDERLGILIVRCTECGRFQPAAVASNAGRVWLSRLASMLVAAWAVFVLGVCVLGSFALGGLQVGAVEVSTSGRYFTPENEQVYRSWDSNTGKTVWLDAKTGQPVDITEPVWRRSLRPVKELTEEPVPAVLLLGLMTFAPMIFGGILAVLMWHVSRGRLLLTLLLPALAAGFVISLFHVDESDRGGNTRLVASIVAGMAVAQMILMLTGTVIGRPVARFFATLFIPPKPRQAIAFLWTVDGKPSPRVE